MEKDRRPFYVWKTRREGYMAHCFSQWSGCENEVANDLSFVLISVSLVFCINLLLNFVVRKENKNV